MLVSGLHAEKPIVPIKHCLRGSSCFCESLSKQRGGEIDGLKLPNSISGLTVPTENPCLALLSRMPSLAQHFLCTSADAYILDWR